MMKNKQTAGITNPPIIILTMSCSIGEYIHKKNLKKCFTLFKNYGLISPMNETRKVKVTAKPNANKINRCRIHDRGMFGFWVNETPSHDGKSILLREVRVKQLNDGTWIDLPARGGWMRWFPLDEIEMVDIK
jgi:hypothetical protein